MTDPESGRTRVVFEEEVITPTETPEERQKRLEAELGIGGVTNG
jgi:hypothetical protein